MHNVNYVQFLITLGIGLGATTLTSRLILLLLSGRGLGIERLAYANGASLVVCWILFVVICSTSEKIYWLAGHVAFVPQALWLIFDILRFEEDGAHEAESSGFRLP